MKEIEVTFTTELLKQMGKALYKVNNAIYLIRKKEYKKAVKKLEIASNILGDDD